jgi:hypothetical protein
MSERVRADACGLQDDEYSDDARYRLRRADARGRVYERVEGT